MNVDLEKLFADGALDEAQLAEVRRQVREERWRSWDEIDELRRQSKRHADRSVWMSVLACILAAVAIIARLVK